MTGLRTLKSTRHDHRRSLWVVQAGVHNLLWCYRCGAIRYDLQDSKWHRPTGPNGHNPAVPKGLR